MAIMIKDLLNALQFSKSETRVIVFVAVVIASGYVIRNFNQFVEDAEKSYDYSGTDSAFINKSLNRVSSYSFSATEDSSVHDPVKFASEIEAAGKRFDSSDINTTAYGGTTVNINTAGKHELEGLPGIGEATAERIIIYREEKSSFVRIEDLMKVKGIGKKKFDKLKELITVK